MKVTVVAEQTAPTGAAFTETDGVSTGSTVMFTWFEVAVAVLTQVRFDVMMHVTTSLLARAELLYDAPVPTFTPFTFH